MREEKVKLYGIEFEEDQNEGYAPRTRKNASADVTVAFAIDFTTAGEKLTKRCVKEQGNLYIPITITNTNHGEKDAEKIVKKILDLEQEEITINIAGNGIYTFNQYTQDDIDFFIHHTFLYVHTMLKNRGVSILTVRSGGQTGVDEAGIKSARTFPDIKRVICLAPKGWKFRNKMNRDISDEKEFKERFAI